VPNIICLRNDRFGEFLLSIPAFRALKQLFPGFKLILAVDTVVADIARFIPGVDEVLIWENRKHSLAEVLSFSRELRRKRIGVFAVFNPSKQAHLISFLSAAKVRLGWKRKWDFFLTHKASDQKHAGNKHEIDSNLELVSVLGIKDFDKRLSLNIDTKQADGFLSGIVVHPWTSDQVKQWPLENFRGLIERLLKCCNLPIIIVGGKEQLQEAERVFFGLDKQKVFDYTGKTTLPQLAGILKKSSLLISGDSGPVHLASCVDTPTIAIFRNDIPGKCPLRWGPRASRSAVLEAKSLQDISVEDVLNKAKEFLKI
jgi:ADP-heptose:LPS heptosyltransferase